MELHEYDAEINGMQTTLLLTADQAKKRGLTKRAAKATTKADAKPQGKAAAAPANKAVGSPNDKSGQGEQSST